MRKVTATIEVPRLVSIGREEDGSHIYEEVGTREVEVTADVQADEEKCEVGPIACTEWLDARTLSRAQDALLAKYCRLEGISEDEEQPTEESKVCNGCGRYRWYARAVCDDCLGRSEEAP